jgi:hypothetical protein
VPGLVGRERRERAHLRVRLASTAYILAS